MLDPSQTVARDHYTYVPNPHYWNKDAVYWDKIVVRTITNPNAALQALKHRPGPGRRGASRSTSLDAPSAPG